MTEVQRAGGKIGDEQSRKRHRQAQVRPTRKRPGAAHRVVAKEDGDVWQEAKRDERRPERRRRQHHAARRNETRVAAQVQNQQRAQRRRKDVGRVPEGLEVGQVHRPPPAKRHQFGVAEVDSRPSQGIEPQLKPLDAPTQQRAQRVHAAEQDEHPGGDNGAPAAKSAREQEQDQRDAEARPQRHRPVQRRRAEQAAGKAGHHVPSQVVAQQRPSLAAAPRQVVRQAVAEADGPRVPAQIEQQGAPIPPVEVVAVEQAAVGGEHRTREAQPRDGERVPRRPRRTPRPAQRRHQSQSHEQRCWKSEPPLEPADQPDEHRHHQVEDGAPVKEWQAFRVPTRPEQRRQGVSLEQRQSPLLRASNDRHVAAPRLHPLATVGHRPRVSKPASIVSLAHPAAHQALGVEQTKSASGA